MKQPNFGRINEQPFFTPWIGETYQKYLDSDGEPNEPLPNSGVRYHLMSESHYAEGETPSSDWTCRAVQNLALERNAHGAFWTKAIQTVEGVEASVDLDRRAAWHRVAYSNFLQDALAAPRDPVPEALWERGRRCFFAQLSISRPSVLVVLGKRLFANLPKEGMPAPEPLTLRPEWDPLNDAWLYFYPTPYGPWLTIAVSVPHPSSGRFSGKAAWHRVLTAQLNYSNLLVAFHDGKLTS